MKQLHFSFLTVFYPLAVSTNSFGVKKTVSASKCDNPFGMNQKFRMKNTAAG